MSAKKKRGKPPTEPLEHLRLWGRMRSYINRGKTQRNAAGLVQKKHYPERSEHGIRQTYMELNRVKLDADAEPQSDGLIHAGQWDIHPTRQRMFEAYNRAVLYFRLGKGN